MATAETVYDYLPAPGELDLNADAPDLIKKLAALRDSGIGIAPITMPEQSRFFAGGEAIIASYYMLRADPYDIGAWKLSAGDFKTQVLSFPQIGHKPQTFGAGEFVGGKFQLANDDTADKARDILLAFDGVLSLEGWEEILRQRRHKSILQKVLSR